MGAEGLLGTVMKSLFMTVLSELGDKTFFIAAVMAIKASRIQVLAGALGALVVMTLLSAVAGAIAPALIPHMWTSRLATGLFFIFGFRMVYNALFASKVDGMAEELAEVEKELSPAGGVGGEEKSDAQKTVSHIVKANAVGRYFSQLMSPVVFQAFLLTFLAEWGDRSQLATFGLAAQSGVLGVSLGGILGHGLCSGCAVMGGRHVSKYVTERTLALCGGGLFLLFGLQGLVGII